MSDELTLGLSKVDLVFMPGDGTAWWLANDVGPGRLAMTPRQKALALALLDVARQNVENSELPS